MTYVIAFYEIDRAYGGREEGGWWFDTGKLVRIGRTFKRRSAALKWMDRANHLLDIVQDGKRDVGSVLYDGGRYRAELHENIPPAFYPATRPHYE